jgi:hypothetical protein
MMRYYNAEDAEYPALLDGVHYYIEASTSPDYPPCGFAVVEWSGTPLMWGGMVHERVSGEKSPQFAYHTTYTEHI